MSATTTTTIIGKRKRNPEAYYPEPSTRRTSERSTSVESASGVSDSEGGSNDEEDAGTTTPTTPITSRSPFSRAPSQKRPLRYFCDFPDCTKAFSRPVRLEEHKRSHTNDRIFKCPHPPCPKDFLRETHLKVHIKNAHDNVRDHFCDWPGCRKGFSTGTRLRRHREAHEKPKKHEFRCKSYPPCREVFRKQGTLQRHVDAVHLQARPLHCPHKDPATGTPCPSSFDKQSSLRSHEAQYHGSSRYKCEVCASSPSSDEPPPQTPETFESYADLQNHINTVHPPYCPHCALVFTTNAQVRAHIELYHNTPSATERKSFPCPDSACEKTFTKQGNLNVHIRTQHEKQKNFICGDTDISATVGLEGWDGKNACGKHFTTKQSCAVHVRRHHLPGSKPKGARKQERKRRKVGALEKLTGSGGGGVMNGLACFVEDCGELFEVVAELRDHAVAVHGLSEAEVVEKLAELEAMNGGRFWVGTGEDDDVEEEDYTGLGQETVNVRNGLPRADDQEGEGGEQEYSRIADMLSDFVRGSARDDEFSVIDPVLLA